MALEWDHPKFVTLWLEKVKLEENIRKKNSVSLNLSVSLPQTNTSLKRYLLHISVWKDFASKCIVLKAELYVTGLERHSVCRCVCVGTFSPETLQVGAVKGLKLALVWWVHY